MWKRRGQYPRGQGKPEWDAILGKHVPITLDCFNHFQHHLLLQDWPCRSCQSSIDIGLVEKSIHSMAVMQHAVRLLFDMMDCLNRSVGLIPYHAYLVTISSQ